MIENKAIKIDPYDTPWEIACKLINATYTYENMLGQKNTGPMFANEDLQRIGEHLVNYARTEAMKDGK